MLLIFLNQCFTATLDEGKKLEIELYKKIEDLKNQLPDNVRNEWSTYYTLFNHHNIIKENLTKLESELDEAKEKLKKLEDEKEKLEKSFLRDVEDNFIEGVTKDLFEKEHEAIKSQMDKLEKKTIEI